MSELTEENEFFWQQVITYVTSSPVVQQHLLDIQLLSFILDILSLIQDSKAVEQVLHKSRLNVIIL